MANMITLDIQTPLNELLAESQIPEDYSIKEMVDELVDLLELPRFDDERMPIEYSMYSLRANSYLPADDTVGAALRDGDEVRLEAKSNGRAVPINEGGKGSVPATVPVGNGNEKPDEISVLLSVLDLNRTEQITLSTSRPVSELIRQIVGNYNLPPRDKFGQINKYRLRSKALGSFLLETATLGQAGVPTLDRLFLHRDEIAGAERATRRS